MQSKPILPVKWPTILILAAGSVLLPHLASATESTAETPKADTSKTHRLNPILVKETSSELGKSTIGGESLQSIPNQTSSITGALKVLSDVQFSNSENSSLTGGEIRPPRISINGAKPYENSFTIDGIGNTNTINPSGLGAEDNNAGANFNDLGVHGADQNLFYDINLVESVTAYTSNVPAKYGGFTGGLIDAESCVIHAPTVGISPFPAYIRETNGSSCVTWTKNPQNPTINPIFQNTNSMRFWKAL